MGGTMTIKETVQPDVTLTRQFRIERLEKLLEKAEKDDNIGLIRKFTKEIEIQKCYLQIEVMS
jgi:hypothetical protein